VMTNPQSGRTESLATMPRLTAFVLRHRLLVIMFWILCAAAGGATATTTVGRLTQSFAMPDSQAQRTADRIAQAYHTDDGAEPDVIVVTLPPAESVDSPGVRDKLAGPFVAARQMGARVVDYSSTGDRALVTDDGRTAFGVVFLPPGGSYRPDVAAALQQAA